MAMYALAITLIISQLEVTEDVKQTWYADDALLAASTCGNLRHWWDELNHRGHLFGYYSNDSKTYLLVKHECQEVAREVRITTHGKRHLGATLGSLSFT